MTLSTKISFLNLVIAIDKSFKDLSILYIKVFYDKLIINYFISRWVRDYLWLVHSIEI